MKSVLSVSAHPDEEALGCGGAIARHSDLRHHVQVLIVAEGATSRQQQRTRLQSGDELSALAQVAQTGGSILGVAGVGLLDLPDNRIDSLDRFYLIKRVEERIDCHQIQVVYVHHAGDVYADHRLLHEAVVTSCRSTPGHLVGRLLSFEVASSTEWQPPGSVPAFKPNWFVDISDQKQPKPEALEGYSSLIRSCPHARSIESVEPFARSRGAQLGVEAEVAFCLLRQLG